MEIPKEFTIFGTTITVEFDNDKGDRERAYGLAEYKQNKIILQNKSDGDVIKDSEIETTFLHESIHIILNKLGCHDLNGDEKFVNQFARALHQFLKTQK